MSLYLNSYGPTGPLGFPLSDKQARNLDTLLKALPKSKEFEYRKTVFLKAPTESNPGERSDVSWISTETPDRYDHVVFAKGMNDSQFGSTNRVGEEPRTRPVHFREVFASLYQRMGIDVAGTHFTDLAGRPQFLVGEYRPLPELTGS